MNFTCPICLYKKLPFYPADFEICPCCGTEFGNDDERVPHATLRTEWINRGARWFFRNPPEGWNPWLQLIEGGAARDVPHIAISYQAQFDAIVEPKRINLIGKRVLCAA